MGLLTLLTSNCEIETFNIEIREIKKSDSTDMVTKGYRQLWLRLCYCAIVEEHAGLHLLLHPFFCDDDQ
jgi:hypothetical protein